MKKKAMRGTGDPRPPDDPEQSKRFEEKARELEADESGELFQRALGVVITSKPAEKLGEPLTPASSRTIVARKKTKPKK